MPRCSQHCQLVSLHNRRQAVGSCRLLLQVPSSDLRLGRLCRDGQCLPCSWTQLCGAYLILCALTNRTVDTFLSSFRFLLSTFCLKSASKLACSLHIVAWPMCKQYAEATTGKGRSEKCRPMRHLQVQTDIRDALVYTIMPGRCLADNRERPLLSVIA